MLQINSNALQHRYFSHATGYQVTLLQDFATKSIMKKKNGRDRQAVAIRVGSNSHYAQKH